MTLSATEEAAMPVFSTAIGDAMLARSVAPSSKKTEYMEVRSQFTAESKPNGAPPSVASAPSVADDASHAGESAKGHDVLGADDVQARIAFARSMFHGKANTVSGAGR